MSVCEMGASACTGIITITGRGGRPRGLCVSDEEAGPDTEEEEAEAPGAPGVQMRTVFKEA